MPIFIKKKDGQVQQVARTNSTNETPPAGPAPEVVGAPDPMEGKSDAERWESIRQRHVEVFLKQLATTPADKLDGKAEVWLAYVLGLGSPEARRHLEKHNIATAEWQRLLPWFAQPYAGDALLPPDATWEVHRTAVDGGHGGWATISFNDPAGTVLTAEAMTPWAAFGICLAKAKLAGLIAPSGILRPETTSE